MATRENNNDYRIRKDIATSKGGKQFLLEDSAGNPVELFETPIQKYDNRDSPSAGKACLARAGEK